MTSPVDFGSETHGQDHHIKGNRAVTVCRPQEGLFRVSDEYLYPRRQKPIVGPLSASDAIGLHKG